MRKRLLGRLRGLGRESRGAEIAELASILPLLVVLLIGILWFGRAFNIYTTVNHAARAAAVAASVRGCATCGNGFADGTVQSNVVNPILAASHLDPGQVQGFTILHGQPMNPNSGNNVLGVVVTMSYPYNFKLNGLTCCPPQITPLTLGVTVHATAQAQEEN